MSTPEGLGAQIVARVAQDVESKVNAPPWEPTSFWASMIGDCSRALFYGRALWPWRRPLPAQVQGRLMVGDWVHTAARQYLERLGFDVIAHETRIRLAGLDISGRIDMTMRDRTTGRPTLVEVKSVSDFAQHNLADLNGREYTRKYRRQLGVYLMARGAESGYLLFVAIPSGLFIPVQIDNTAALREEIAAIVKPAREAFDAWDIHHGTDRARAAAKLQSETMSAVSAFVASADVSTLAGIVATARGTLDALHSVTEAREKFHQLEIDLRQLAEEVAPDRIPYDPGVCTSCPWFVQCKPAVGARPGGLARYDDEELIQAVGVLRGPIKAEHDRLSKIVDGAKDLLKHRLTPDPPAPVSAIIGDALVTMSARSRVNVSLPPEVAAAHPEWTSTSRWCQLESIDAVKPEAAPEVASEQRAVFERLQQVRESRLAAEAEAEPGPKAKKARSKRGA